MEKTGKYEGWVEDDFIVYIKEKANKISASKLNQEMSAVVYFYRVMLRIDVSHCLSDLRAKRKWKKVEFLNRTEIYLLIGCQGYMEGLVMKLMYGSGLRCGEVLPT